MRLGDSLGKIVSLLDLEISAVDSALKFESKKPFIKKEKHGLSQIFVFGDFDNNKLMKSFKAVWIYKGDKSAASRTEFLNIILDYSFGCLWEESLNMYKEKDTIKMDYFNNQINQFTTDLRNDMSIPVYEAYMK